MNVRNVKEYLELPLLHNHWYVAGFGDEFDQTPTARTLLEESIVFYRTGSGELIAMQNRCLHRSFPLSEGKVDGDQIVCGYHGACYGSDGQMVHVPTQSNAPNISLRTYPVKEVGPLILIWMGAGAADESRLPDLAHLEDPAFRTMRGYYHVEGSYLLMQENLHDLSHVAYLHRETFQVDERFHENPTEVEMTDRGAVAKRTHLYDQASFLPPGVLQSMGDSPIWRTDWGVSPSPGIHEALIHTGKGENEGDDDAPKVQFIMHFLTPQTMTTCHYWWAVSLDHGTDEDMFFEMAPQMFKAGFEEDVTAMKHMQELLTAHPAGFDESHFGSDKHGMMFRRVVQQWVNEEHGEPAVVE